MKHLVTCSALTARLASALAKSFLYRSKDRESSAHTLSPQQQQGRDQMTVNEPSEEPYAFDLVLDLR